MNAQVDAYIQRSVKWPDEMAALRPVLLKCGLSEAIKWGKPCFSHGEKNIVIMQEMNDFLALMFFKGALIEDPEGILVEQGPNSRSALRIEFTSVKHVKSMAKNIARYVDAAIAVEERGIELAPAPVLVLVAELQARLDGDPKLSAAFESLTPGRRREYHLHISSAKQSATREARVDKCTARILAGKGLRDT